MVGAGSGHKHAYYYGPPDDKETRQEKRRLEKKNVLQELETVKAKMPALIKEKVKNLVPKLMARMLAWHDAGRQGPMPTEVSSDDEEPQQ